MCKELLDQYQDVEQLMELAYNHDTAYPVSCPQLEGCWGGQQDTTETFSSELWKSSQQPGFKPRRGRIVLVPAAHTEPFLNYPAQYTRSMH